MEKVYYYFTFNFSCLNKFVILTHYFCYSNLWFFVSKFTEFDSKKLLKIYRRGLHTNEKLEKDNKVKDKSKNKSKDKFKEDKKNQKIVS